MKRLIFILFFVLGGGVSVTLGVLDVPSVASEAFGAVALLYFVSAFAALTILARP